MSKVKSFVKQAIAALTGDKSEVIAQKIYRASKSAISSQVSLLDGSLMDLEDALEEAKANVQLTLINKGQKIEDKTQYLTNLMDAHNKVLQAEERLEAHEAKIDFFAKKLIEIDIEEEE